MKTDWHIKKLGEICEILDSRRKPVTKRDRVAGIYPYYGATGILDHVNNFIFDEKLILVGEDGAKWGEGEKTAFPAEGKYWVNNHAHVLRPKRNIVLDDWIINYLNSSDLSEYITGVTVPKLNQSKLREIAIPIPPINQQRRIVKALDEVFEEIEKVKENTKKNLHNSQELFRSKLHSVFLSPKKNWEKKSIGDVARVKGGKRVPTGHALQKDPTDHPYIRVSDFNDRGSIDADSIRYLNETTFQQIKNYTISSKDLYISIAGTIGRTGMVPSYLDGANLTENACKLVFEKGTNPRYVYYFTKSDDFLIQAGINTRVAAMPKLALSRLSTISFWIPPNISEQNEIVSKLEDLSDKVEKMEKLYRKKLDKLESLRKSVLQKAFEGEL